MRQQFHALPRPGLAPVGLFAVLLLIVAGCTAGPSPTVPPPAPTATARPATATPAPAPTATVAPAPTVAPTARPTTAPGGMPALHPAGARTGIAGVDAVVDAFLGASLDARRRLVRFLITPCTTAQGLGGPPKCAAGEANGTPVEVFPFLGSEGEFVRRAGIDRVLEFQTAGLYGVYRVPASAFRADYWPAGEYAVVFAGQIDPKSSVAGVNQLIVYVQDGAIVRLRRTPFAEPWPPAEAAGATWVLAPVR